MNRSVDSKRVEVLPHFTSFVVVNAVGLVSLAGNSCRSHARVIAERSIHSRTPHPGVPARRAQTS